MNRPDAKVMKKRIYAAFAVAMIMACMPMHAQEKIAQGLEIDKTVDEGTCKAGTVRKDFRHIFE